MVPTKTPSAKNSTFATVAGAPADAEADRVTVEPMIAEAPAAGAVMATVGPPALTVTATVLEETRVPFVSVALACKVTGPVESGVHKIE